MKNLILFIIIFNPLGISCINKSPVTEEKVLTPVTNDPFIRQSGNSLLSGLQEYSSNIENDFVLIPNERKVQLQKLSALVDSATTMGESLNMVFICTHNSRRSHMSQLWAQAAAYYYGIAGVYCYSGGTEVTAFNHRSVRALGKAGFNIEQNDSTANPVYMVRYAEGAEVVKCFSKKYDDGFNPGYNFIAIMTCSQADQSCPLVHGATTRISISYDDPKLADITAEEESKYDERCRQIAIEMFYMFSQVNT